MTAPVIENLVKKYKLDLRTELHKKYPTIRNGQPVSYEEFVVATSNREREYLMAQTLEDLKHRWGYSRIKGRNKMRKAEIVEKLVEIYVQYQAKERYEDLLDIHRGVQEDIKEMKAKRV